MGFFATLDRPFNPLTDWSYFGHAEPAQRLDRQGRGDRRRGRRRRSGLGPARRSCRSRCCALLGCEPHQTRSIAAVTALGVVWVAFAVSGALLRPRRTHRLDERGRPRRTTRCGTFSPVCRIGSRSPRQSLTTPSGDVAGDDLLTRLRGKDVLIAFVESYGRVAVQDSAVSPQVDAVLDAGTRRLRAAGFSSRSAFLTSPTFGGISWLAHATLQSGLWVDNQQRYNQLIDSDRLTLSSAFERAGWRTVGDVAVERTRTGRRGRRSTTTTRSTTAETSATAVRTSATPPCPTSTPCPPSSALELAQPDRAPVMAEIDLVSSHTPWAPLPRMVDWSNVGDGSVFDGMPAQGDIAGRRVARRRPGKGRVRAVHRVLAARPDLLRARPTRDNDLVLIVLGDHQPATIVTGQDASHDVPITIIAHDPAVMDRISSWGWQDGHEAGSARTGLADGRLPRPLPDRVRPEAGQPPRR